MNCLIDKVGLAGCGTTVPASGLTINQLPGISLKSIEKLADEEQRDWTGVWADVQARASKRFAIDVASKLSSRYALNEIPQNVDLGRVVDTTTITANAAEYRGVLFDFNKYQASGVNSYKASDLQSHYFQYFGFYSNGIHAATPFKVFDYETGTTLESFLKDLVVGWNLIASTKNYTEKKIVLAVDATNVSTVELETPNHLEWCSTCCGAKIEGIKWSKASDISTSEKSSNSYGISVIYGARCKWDNLVCNNLDKFVLAWQYLLGVEMTIERMFSDRIGKQTLNRDQGNQLKEFLDGEYDRILTSTCNNINLNTNDCCIECTAQFQTIESHP